MGFPKSRILISAGKLSPRGPSPDFTPKGVSEGMGLPISRICYRRETQSNKAPNRKMSLPQCLDKGQGYFSKPHKSIPSLHRDFAVGNNLYSVVGLYPCRF